MTASNPATPDKSTPPTFKVAAAPFAGAAVLLELGVELVLDGAAELVLIVEGAAEDVFVVVLGAAPDVP